MEVEILKGLQISVYFMSSTENVFLLLLVLVLVNYNISDLIILLLHKVNSI